ncbi:adenylate/guanylate cyclase domain-containing protein [Desulfatitalea alkaliphila]|uniref:Adenylate/guanylate cyclase domain-containing protein n=1 Tax=Desulfatitalea alkaliphila TaxID=2929485 RepID=A0AA41R1H5_9BACT|nr:adenylate/guanylate cyclase domain-containing protein [Desulfatitalea alkaliphila]MCJ8499480.1 adenylate/guanylate cyclase domain-containing protein [Desulfatitalea alkaliphila]
MADDTHQTQAILFADIANSTRLYEQLGDARALELVTSCLSLVEKVTLANHGQVVKTIGDEVMCRFAQPDQAMAAAVGMQETISDDETMVAYRIRLRIGFHYGPVICESGDVYGDAVNVAARMVQQAKAGQIITNHATLQQMAPRHHRTTRLVDETRIKGKQALLTIYEIPWGHPEEMTMISGAMGAAAKGKAKAELRLRLRFQNREVVVDAQTPVVTIGRDAINHLVVNEPRVSRLHARIELRRDKFVLVDQSTNGTYILPADQETVLMRRDEIVLPAAGAISLGHAGFLATPMEIRFQHI